MNFTLDDVNNDYKHLYFNLEIQCTPTKTILTWKPNFDSNEQMRPCQNFRIHYNNIIKYQRMEISCEATKKLLDMHSELKDRLRQSRMVAQNSVVLPINAHPGLKCDAENLYYHLHINRMMKYGYYMQMIIPDTTDDKIL